MKTSAHLSSDRKYRYSLWRTWNESKPHVLFICLNPSTADETQDDRTVTRCIAFAKSWGYGAVCIANLFAYRSRKRSTLEKVDDPVGPENDKWIKKLSKDAGLTVVAWGESGSLLGRDKEVLAMLHEPHCLATTKKGCPKHPLYSSGNLTPKPFGAS